MNSNRHPGFSVSQPVTLRNSKLFSTHIAARCSVHMSKKRVRQRYPNPPENGKIISDVSVGQEFIGTIAKVGPARSSWVDIGVFTKRGRPVHARLPFSIRKGSTSRNDVEGAVVPVYVKKLNPHADRIEVRKGLKPQDVTDVPLDVTMLDSVRVGNKLEGVVVGLGPYGAVVDANIYRVGKGGKVTACHGLLQRKSFRKEWYSAADKVIKSDAERRISKGDAVDVYVRAARVQNAFLLLDAYEVREDDVNEARQQHRATVRRRYRRAPVDTLEVGEIREGIVSNVARYGLFVDVGVKSNGLIHYSEMGERHKRDWKEAIDISTRLIVEVLGVEDSKISLRLVSLKEEALQDAHDIAKSGTARTEDVELAAALQASDKRGNVGKITSNLTKGAKTAHLAAPEFVADEATDDDVKHGTVDEDQDDEDKFSDEYFEDKYGY